MSERAGITTVNSPYAELAGKLAQIETSAFPETARLNVPSRWSITREKKLGDEAGQYRDIELKLGESETSIRVNCPESRNPSEMLEVFLRAYSPMSGRDFELRENCRLLANYFQGALSSFSEIEERGVLEGSGINKHQSPVSYPDHALAFLKLGETFCAVDLTFPKHHRTSTRTSGAYSIAELFVADTENELLQSVQKVYGGLWDIRKNQKDDVFKDLSVIRFQAFSAQAAMSTNCLREVIRASDWDKLSVASQKRLPISESYYRPIEVGSSRYISLFNLEMAHQFQAGDRTFSPKSFLTRLPHPNGDLLVIETIPPALCRHFIDLVPFEDRNAKKIVEALTEPDRSGHSLYRGIPQFICEEALLAAAREKST